MAAETPALKFTIDAVEYEVPGIDELDMDEWQIVYDYAGLILDDFVSLTPGVRALGGEVLRLRGEAAKLSDGSEERLAVDAEAAEAVAKLEAAVDALDGDVLAAEEERQRKLAQPAFTKALLHIGYRRAHPEVKSDAVGKLVGKANFVKVTNAIHEAQAEEEPLVVPLALTPTPARSSPPTSIDSSKDESGDSLTSSDEPESLPEPIGTAV